MPETYGAHESRVYYVVESTYGQTPSNPTMYGLNVESVDPSINANIIQLRTVGSRLPAALHKGLRNPTLKIVEYPRIGVYALFLPAQALTLSSFSIQVLYFKGSWSSPSDVVSLLFKGCRIDRATVEGSVDSFPKTTLEFIGQNLEVGTGKISGATYNDPSGVTVPSDVKIYRGTASGGSFTEITRVTDWKFTVENNLKPVQVVRSSDWHLLKFLPSRHCELNGELTFEFEDKTEFEDVVNDAEFSLKFEIGYGVATFTYCKWQNVETPTKVEDLVSLKARFTARGVSIT